MTKKVPLTELLPTEEIVELEKLISKHEVALWAYWKEFVTQNKRLGKSEKTVESVRNGIRILIRYGQIYSIQKANSPKLMTEVTLRLRESRGVSASTRNTYIKNLNTYFIWLEKNEYIAENKVKKIEKSPETFVEQNCLTAEQIERVFSHLHTRRFSSELERLRSLLYVSVLKHTGARPCELLSMNKNSIYKDKGQWRIKVEGRKLKGRVRYYDCPQFIVHNFEIYLSTREKYSRNESSLFISSSSFNGWTISGVHSFFKKISGELGFQVSSYAFRRFVATYLDAQGIDKVHIARHLGHTRITTTERYIARSGSLTQKTSAAMESSSVSASRLISTSVSLNKKDKSLLS